mgnify:CR=1 FL=1
MYRRPKFLEILLEIRKQMALEADYDVDLFTEIARAGVRPHKVRSRRPPIDLEGERSGEAVIPELSRSKDI